MRQTISPQHRTLFVKQGWIVFEGALSEKACSELQKMSPLSMRSPALRAWMKKYQVIEWLYELTGRDPLRVAPLSSFQPKDLVVQVDSLTGNLTYHLDALPTGESSLAWICTDRYLDPTRYPLIFHRGG